MEKTEEEIKKEGEKMLEEKNSPKKEQFELVEVPTEYGIMVSTPEGEKITQLELLIRIANQIEEIKKVVG